MVIQMTAKIIGVKARQVLDSRGTPTVEAEVLTSKGVFSAIVPSGASTGSFEAVELRDGGKPFGGKAVSKAVSNVNGPIASAVKGMDAVELRDIDEKLCRLDGTPNKGKLGANAILAVSMACSRAAAAEEGIPLYVFLARLAGNKKLCLPVPQMNVINGGKHAGIENDFQEHMMAPTGAKNFAEALEIGVEVYSALKSILKKKFGSSASLVGDEGGFASSKVKTVQERFDLVLGAAREVGREKKIVLALDSASSEFGVGGEYTVGGKKLTSEQLIDFYEQLVKDYPVYSLEDGMSEEDWNGWSELNKRIGKKVQIVGDDLLVTNVERIKRAVGECSCNALLLKPNQIGSVSEAIDAALSARKAGWNVVVSHRSGETEDSFISDLVVGLGAGQSKFGAPCRSDRNAKYNQLLRIEEQLGAKACFGWKC